MRSIKVVFFDAAGTLFHVRGSVGQIYANAARPFGICADPERLQQSFINAFRAASAQGFPAERAHDLRAAERSWWMSVVRGAFGAEMPEQVLPDYFSTVFELFRGPEAWVLYPDSTSTLEDLRSRGYRLGVISNFDSRLHDVLSNLGINAFFDRVTLSWQLGIAKPDAGIFRCALEAMAVEGSEAAHVGDSVEEDVVGALNAGLGAFLLDRNGRHGVPDKAVRIRALGELRSLLPGVNFQ